MGFVLSLDSILFRFKIKVSVFFVLIFYGFLNTVVCWRLFSITCSYSNYILTLCLLD